MILTCVSTGNSIINADKIGNFAWFLEQQTNSGIDQGHTVLEKFCIYTENTLQSSKFKVFS